MVHRIVLSTFGLLTLAMCQNQKLSQNSASSEKTEVTTETPVSSTKSTSMETPKTSEPEMSSGMPPDKEAVKIAKEETATANRNTAGVIYLKEGQNLFLKQYEMNVTFKGITEDSRCPQGVNCIWEGVATAEVEFMGLATRPVTIKLSTTNNAQRGYSRTQDFNGYAVSLVELSPETTTSKGFKALKGSYKIGLKFEKGSPVDPKTQRGGTTTK